METHSEGPEHIDSVDQLVYHCLRRWPNIKTTLGRRFVFDIITTVILIGKCST